ncbi:MAG: methionine--tRNA ligase, partial [Verrucomicrobia bacterium]|nr:methionine--tRNA ligase [Verrucomicrobiota bacterium]
MNRKKFYVTTPIYYVNDEPHIGHAYTTILADVLAQYHRLLKIPTHFLTGTDEHGQKVQKAAQAAGISPQEQADRTVVRFQLLWKQLEITNDDFIRTTEERHKRVVQKILQDLYDRGEIYRAEYDGWYCVPDERFFMEKDLAEGKCPECGRPVEKLTEANYFFRMSKYQEWLVQYIRDNPKFIQPDFRRNETLGFLRKPLNDLCISRPKSRMNWGIDLPFDPEYVTYVWFDALVNYISAVGYLDDADTFAKWWPVSYHLIGKDILTTHTVYWPTMLKAMGLPMPETVFAHGWWLSGEDKMSKSLGNVVNPMDMIGKTGVDAFRYFLIAEMVLGQDAAFTAEAFTRRYNADLANDLGNLLNRVLAMITRYSEGKMPEPSTAVLEEPDGKALWETVQSAVQTMETALEQMRLNEGLGQVIRAVRAVNRYLELRQPWTLAKAVDPVPLRDCLYTASEALRVLAGLLYPVMPRKMAELRKALGMARPRPDIRRFRVWGVLKPCATVRTPGALFPRLTEEEEGKDKQIELIPPEPSETPSAPPAAPVSPPSAEENPAPPIEYDDFAKVQLRTAKILQAYKIQGTAKLVRLEVLIGEERRQLVAGIALHYEPEQLIGKTIVLVANLKPVVIRGVESQGMLLAATKG